MQAARRLSDRLALAGGALLLGMAALIAASVLLRWLTRQGIPGDFELLQIGLALAVFSFMPLCQIRAGNLFVDTFTGRLPAAVQRHIDGVWSLTYAVVAILIATMMAIGAVETLSAGTTTMVLELPLGWPIAICAVLSAWLAWVVLLTAADALWARDR